MAVQQISITDFLSLAKRYPVVDVRSPLEYGHGHFPGAHSLPLFTDDERKVVGTIYKQESREKAIKTGLSFFGQKMVKIVEDAEAIVNETIQAGHSKTVLLHCWRGGMRSAGMAWLLDLYGFHVYMLNGGYKSFRHWTIEQYKRRYNLQVVGGYTASGKTSLLKQIAAVGESMIDLEGLARHKGSAFGNLDKTPQPTQEMFENELALQLGAANPNVPLWIEDESQRIGRINIPPDFFKQMCRARLFFLQLPFEERLQQLVIEYGRSNREGLETAIVRIKKRLGGLAMKQALAFLSEEKIEECFRILLLYYDKQYSKALEKTRDSHHIVRVEATTVDPVRNTMLLLQKKSPAV